MEARTVSLFAPLPTTPGGWPCIVADPPWSYRDTGSRLAPDQRRKRGKRKGYGTLSLEDIAALPIRELAARDAFLFLWTTDAHLVDGSAAEVAIRWGFEPKRTWTWVKTGKAPVDLRAVLAEQVELLRNEGHGLRARALARSLRAARRDLHLGTLAFGGGHYVRTATERVLICRRGRASFLVHDERDVFFAPRRANGLTGEVHSTKPPELLAKVERVCVGPRLELFAREDRPGWRAWGNQVPPYHRGDGCPNCGSNDTVTGRGGWLLDCQRCGFDFTDRSPEVAPRRSAA
jgi:N6-adenosine-specific RNA methylase IME4